MAKILARKRLSILTICFFSEREHGLIADIKEQTDMSGLEKREVYYSLNLVKFNALEENKSTEQEDTLKHGQRGTKQ